MSAISTALSNGITATTVASTIPNVGTALVAIILFSIGMHIFKRFLSGASKMKAKI